MSKISNCNPPTKPEFSRLILIRTSSFISPESDVALIETTVPMVTDPSLIWLFTMEPSSSLTVRLNASRLKNPDKMSDPLKCRLTTKPSFPGSIPSPEFVKKTTLASPLFKIL